MPRAPTLDIGAINSRAWLTFDCDSEAEAAARLLEARPLSQLRVVTWNVWFDALAQTVRMDALLREVLQVAPDVVCFQEVVPELADAVRASSALSAIYDISYGDVTLHGTMMLARKDLKVVFTQTWLPGDMGRVLLMAEATGRWPGLLVATAHLESLNSENERRKQVELAAWLFAEGHRKDAPIVFCGDFNFDATRTWGEWRRPELARRSDQLENCMLRKYLPDFEDAWPVVRSDEGFTFDGRTNPQCVKDPDERMRYDRILYRRHGLAAVSAVLLGTGQINDWGLRPSDHFGLSVDLDISSHASNASRSNDLVQLLRRVSTAFQQRIV